MAARNKQEGAEKPAETGFDQRLERLEALVGELENGGLGLEASIARYQEGVTLLRECRTTLESFRKRVEELAADGTSAPYAGDPDARAEGG
jgi:exodeoxyribonuclease VII small subunit